MLTAIANHLWQSTAFAAVAALLAFSLRAYRAHTRHCIWLIASLKFLVPFSLLTGLGTLLPAPARVDTPPHVAALVEEISRPFVPLPPQPRLPSQSNSLAIVLLLAVWAAGSASVLLSWYRRWR